ncbi:MAG: hypothetical protein AB8B69_01680 [Chitinophagales bacterium]
MHLPSSAKKILFKQLVQKVEVEWVKKITELEMAVPPMAVLIEMIRLHSRTLLQDNHVIDLALLETQPNELVVKYQGMIAHIVRKQVGENSDWSADMQEELIAQIRENLLRKIARSKLLSQFKGKAAFHSYFYRVIYHSMIDELRKLKKVKRITSIDGLSPQEQKQYAVAPNEVAYSELMYQHLRWLKAVIKGFPLQKQRRFEFVLMVMYRICLKAEDVRGLYADCQDDLLVEILSYFSINYQHLSQAELYKLLSSFVKFLENSSKNIRPDALRVWFSSRLTSIKNTLFKDLPSTKDASLDRYFELLVYKMYKKS